MPNNLTYGVSVSAGGVTIQQSAARTGNVVIGCQASVPAGKAVTAWVKTSASIADCNLPAGHGYANGNFDVFWTGGVRYNVPGTISTNALTLNGGAGTDFPASATTPVTVCRNTSDALLIDGDNAKHVSVVAESSDSASTAKAHVTFEDAAGDDIAQLTLTANIPQVFDIQGGSSNPFAGDIIVLAIWGNGSATEALTLKVVGIQ